MHEKTAQDILESLRHGISQVPNMASQAGGSIKDWYNNLNPEMRSAVMRGLAGAGVGALATGGLAHMSPHDPEARHPVMGPALMGALLGGGTAAALPYGLKLLANKAQMPGESEQSIGATAMDKLVGLVGGNPAATVGTAAGAGSLIHAMSKRKNPAFKGKPDQPQYVDSPLRQAWESTGGAAQPAKRGVLDIMHDLTDPAKRNAAIQELKGFGRKSVKPGTYAASAKEIPGKGINFAKRVRDTWRKDPAGKWSLAAIPAGLGVGHILDKYLKGEY